MPGINQLKKFIDNMSSIGDEKNVREQRGELYIPLSLPTGIKDVNDADDFLYGFSDADSDGQIDSYGDINPESMNPDDFNLDYLISDGNDGFTEDNPTEDFQSEIQTSESNFNSEPTFSLPEEDINLDALNDFMENSQSESVQSDSISSDDDFSVSEDSLNFLSQKVDDGSESFSTEQSFDLQDIPNVIPDEISPIESFEIPQDEEPAQEAISDPLSVLGNFDDFNQVDTPDDFDTQDEFSLQATDDLAKNFASNFSETETIPELDGIDDDLAELEEIGELEELESFDETLNEENSSNQNRDLKSSSDVQDFNLDELEPVDFDSDSVMQDFSMQTDDIQSVANDPDFSDLGFEVENFEPQQSNAQSSSDVIDFDGITVDEFTPSAPVEKSKKSDSDGMSFGSSDFSLDDIPEVEFSDSEQNIASTNSDMDFGDIEFVDEGNSDVGVSDILSELDSSQNFPSNDSFDSLSGIDSLDSISDFGSSSTDDLDTLSLDSLDDFVTTDEVMANNGASDFDIPGFSSSGDDFDFDYSEPNVNTDSSFAVPVEKRTSLTEEEYKTFKKNLHDYPLNLRIEIEKLIVNNEFKDDAVFAVIEKIINGAAARQVSAHLSKYLDISVDVPRDFERRTAEQYDNYKKSLEYQLKNRILPLCVVSIFAIFICIGLFFLIERFVYRPVMADMLYKEGYELLENNLFPQSEVTFNRAVGFKPKKKWFLKYARGYCQKKQYDRSRRMYENTLLRFNHDKLSGMEYAQMELYELFNYERAEEIIKREILDYHINDPDAMLLLGDVYLEWATEKDSEKFKEAFTQYTDLINLFGNSDEYTKRLLRYYIRTDNLREVLPIKAYFYGLKKNVLESSDLVELSGYLLDKLYGYLSPSDEYLRTQIENVRQLLEMAIEADTTVPEAHYNLARYFIYTDNESNAQLLLNSALTQFENLKTRKPKRIQKNIDCFRLLGEIYTNQQQYLLAEETYGKGILLFEEEQKNSFLKATPEIGKLYADLGDLDYFISGNIDNALLNFNKAITNEYDNVSVNYKIGYIYYANKNYEQALSAFIKSSQEKSEDKHLLYSLGNVLALRNDDYSAQGYYERLIDKLDLERARAGILMPQIQNSDGELVDLYMKTSNNLGVVLNRLAKRTGDSSLNAQAMVNLSESLRAWDALTRNQTTMVRLEGSNLAAQNLKYISHPYSDFEPSIYISIPRVLDGEHILEQTFVK